MSQDSFLNMIIAIHWLGGCRSRGQMQWTGLHGEQQPQEVREKDLIIIYKCSYCAFAQTEAVSHFRIMCII